MRLKVTTLRARLRPVSRSIAIIICLYVKKWAYNHNCTCADRRLFCTFRRGQYMFGHHGVLTGRSQQQRSSRGRQESIRLQRTVHYIYYTRDAWWIAQHSNFNNICSQLGIFTQPLINGEFPKRVTDAIKKVNEREKINIERLIPFTEEEKKIIKGNVALRHFIYEHCKLLPKCIIVLTTLFHKLEYLWRTLLYNNRKICISKDDHL
jgi:hypothetical protein